MQPGGALVELPRRDLTMHRYLPLFAFAASLAAQPTIDLGPVSEADAANRLISGKLLKNGPPSQGLRDSHASRRLGNHGRRRSGLPPPDQVPGRGRRSPALHRLRSGRRRSHAPSAQPARAGLRPLSRPRPVRRRRTSGRTLSTAPTSSSSFTPPPATLPSSRPSLSPKSRTALPTPATRSATASATPANATSTSTAIPNGSSPAAPSP